MYVMKIKDEVGEHDGYNYAVGVWPLGRCLGVYLRNEKGVFPLCDDGETPCPLVLDQNSARDHLLRWYGLETDETKKDKINKAIKYLEYLDES